MNQKRIYLFICLIILLPSLVLASDSTRVYRGFTGGMMFHSGYLFGNTPSAPVATEGATFGIGGALYIHLWDHLRLGADGYVSTMPSTVTSARNQLKHGSYLRTGCGGIVAHAFWKKDKCWPYIGAGIGGGSTSALYVMDGDQGDWLPEGNTILHKQPFVYVTPHVGCDICLTTKVHLTLKADWQFAFSSHTSSPLLHPFGPRLYIGFLFSHH